MQSSQTLRLSAHSAHSVETKGAEIIFSMPHYTVESVFKNVCISQRFYINAEKDLYKIIKRLLLQVLFIKFVFPGLHQKNALECGETGHMRAPCF